MGQGEPLNNITNVARAVQQMTSPAAFRLGRSKVSLDLSAKFTRRIVLALQRPPGARFLPMLLQRCVGDQVAKAKECCGLARPFAADGICDRRARARARPWMWMWM